MSQFFLPELDAMQQIAQIIDGLSLEERRRVSNWLMDYALQGQNDTNSFEIVDVAPADNVTITTEDDTYADKTVDEDEDHLDDGDESVEVVEDASGEASLTTFAELYEKAEPKKGAQKAAVAGYWLETKQGVESWKAFDVNKLLKSIGVSVSSMSIVLTNGVKAKTPLVEELGRLGDGERSRKTFHLSEAGRAYVEGLLV